MFKNIRTRYLSRVHSVNDFTKDTNLVDQAFFKLNNNVPQNDSVETPNSITLEINNVTTDETSEDDIIEAGSEDFSDKVLTEVALPSGHKGLKRQNAISISASEDDLCDSSNSSKKVKHISKSESNNPDIRKERTIFSRNLSGLFNGKPKSYSTDNLNDNEEFKNALKEATSIEFLGDTYNVSNSSLFSDGSDCVFLPIMETNNNLIHEINNENEKKLNTGEIKVNQRIPVVKAESILPYPYPDDIREKKIVIDTFKQPLKCNVTEDDSIESNLKRVSAEIQVNFQAALDRIGGSKKENNIHVSQRTENVVPIFADPQHEVIDINVEIPDSIPVKRLSTFKGNVSFEDKDVTCTDKAIKTEESCESNQSSSCGGTHSKSNSGESILVIEIDEEDVVDHDHFSPQHSKESTDMLQDQLDTKVVENGGKSQGNILESNDEYMNQAKKSLPSTDPPIDDNVSYHLRINSVSDFTPPSLPGEADANKKTKVMSVQTNRARNKVNTLFTPIDVVNTNVDRASSSIIISPVLIQPIFFKPHNSNLDPEQKTENKKGVVYYNDIDQVVTKENKKTEITVAHDSDNESRKKGIYQKNVRMKPLAFFPLRKTGSSENEIETRSASTSPRKTPPLTPTKPVAKLSKTPEWLIDNQYYQPMENIPFVINTAQTFVQPNVLRKEQITNNVNTNAFLPQNEFKKEAEQENYYEEIGQPMPPIPSPKNVADDDKISKKNMPADDFPSINREELLKVPRRPKRTKRHDANSPTVPLKENDTPDKEVASITKSVISLSRTPSANEIVMKKPAGSVGDIVQSLERSQRIESSAIPEPPLRKFSLQGPSAPNMEPNTGSLPRLRKTYHWKTLEHKRLSHPIRSLNDSPPSRALRKLGFAYIVV